MTKECSSLSILGGSYDYKWAEFLTFIVIQTANSAII